MAPRLKQVLKKARTYRYSSYININKELSDLCPDASGREDFLRNHHDVIR